SLLLLSICTFFPYTTLFRSVKGIDSNFVIVVGANSTLLFYNGKEWLKDLSVKNIDDNFYDVDVVIDSSSTPMIWITGGTGIYTRSEEHTSELQSRENLVCRL